MFLATSFALGQVDFGLGDHASDSDVQYEAEIDQYLEDDDPTDDPAELVLRLLVGDEVAEQQQAVAYDEGQQVIEAFLPVGDRVGEGTCSNGVGSAEDNEVQDQEGLRVLVVFDHHNECCEGQSFRCEH